MHRSGKRLNLKKKVREPEGAKEVHSGARKEGSYKADGRKKRKGGGEGGPERNGGEKGDLNRDFKGRRGMKRRTNTRKACRAHLRCLWESRRKAVKEAKSWARNLRVPVRKLI